MKYDDIHLIVENHLFKDTVRQAFSNKLRAMDYNKRELEILQYLMEGLKEFKLIVTNCHNDLKVASLGVGVTISCTGMTCIYFLRGMLRHYIILST